MTMVATTTATATTATTTVIIIKANTISVGKKSQIGGDNNSKRKKAQDLQDVSYLGYDNNEPLVLTEEWNTIGDGFVGEMAIL